MPQLDIFSYPTQIFWLIFCLVAVYFGLIKFVLPELMYILRLRVLLLISLDKKNKVQSSITNDFQVKIQNQFEQSTFPKIDAVLTSIVDDTFTKKATKFKLDFLVKLGKENLMALLKANKYGIFFTTVIAPIDDFILLLSFLSFFLFLYFYYARILLNDQLDTRINDIRQRILDLNNKQVINVQLKADLIEEFSKLTDDKKKI